MPLLLGIYKGTANTEKGAVNLLNGPVEAKTHRFSSKPCIGL